MKIYLITNDVIFLLKSKIIFGTFLNRKDLYVNGLSILTFVYFDK